MSTNKKALFFDIDGTILSEVTGKIPNLPLLPCKRPMISDIFYLSTPDGPSAVCRR